MAPALPDHLGLDHARDVRLVFDPGSHGASVLQNLVAVFVFDLILVVLFVLAAVVTRSMYDTTYAMDRNGVTKQLGHGGPRSAEAISLAARASHALDLNPNDPVAAAEVKRYVGTVVLWKEISYIKYLDGYDTITIRGRTIRDLIYLHTLPGDYQRIKHEVQFHAAAWGVG